VKPVRPDDPQYINGGLAAGGGFTDQEAQAAGRAHSYTFTFTGVSVSNFSLHMLDYGDWNYPQTVDHLVTITAYGANGQPIPDASQVLSYTSEPVAEPHASSYGDLYITGDAVTALPGQPGNWIWNISGSGITRVVLEFGVGYDPNIALDLLSFTTECASCQSFTRANFNSVPIGQPVEGLGTVAQYLSIDAINGTAVRVGRGTLPLAYLAPNVKPVRPDDPQYINGGLAVGGGFTDQDAQAARQAHQYSFTFAPGITITNFSLHMLDYGDWNYPESQDHQVIITAYGANGQPIPNASEVLSFTSEPVAEPHVSSYGDLYVTGDAVTALPRLPGNWTWHVAGNGITKVVLEFGAGYDPNIAFDLLSFNVVCP
jgi:hypothetical protein